MDLPIPTDWVPLLIFMAATFWTAALALFVEWGRARIRANYGIHPDRLDLERIRQGQHVPRRRIASPARTEEATWKTNKPRDEEEGKGPSG
ncbi:hypothetical protein DTO164E3_7492 [Paecilomyces variotii]|nr:hypothetical protein DTO164E3_7492 [Paecilomyces variotii]KAJ9201531.1 hypothetical protein DTO032I3_4158 [Paecilomyces variotii]KAJ9275685.1 hypothetical protein DTO021D3_7505 [Paecilomyces variotii]KAJ9339967.1 hypothetical protein DTO027B6_7538 [Paecilomyces variotii]KAJ9377298.1 hypothetical protein DTO032I4_8215 [Paecilomyces variotii]